MPYGLKRYHESKQSHFLTFSCYKRRSRFADAAICEVFLGCLERMRRKYRFRVYGYVVMPEHVHLLVSEPERATLAHSIQALKVSLVRNLTTRQRGSEPNFWQKRYYDHNVRLHDSFVEKLRYIHRNPVKRRLCAEPEDWQWSSFRHYATAELGPVEIESQWTAERRRERMPRPLQI